MLGTLGRLVDQKSKLEECQSPLRAIRYALTSVFAAATHRDSTLLVPNHHSIREEMLFSEPATFKAVSHALSHGQPVFVMRGTLERMAQFFGIDRAHSIQIMLSNSGLLICFGVVDGQEVVVYAAESPEYEVSIARQLIGNSIGRNAFGSLAPTVLLNNDYRVTVARLPGSPVRVHTMSEGDLQRMIMTGLQPLLRVYANGRDARGGGDQALISTIVKFIDAHPYSHRIAGASERLMRWNGTRPVALPVHGDYWANNLLIANGQVTGIVDWDRARELGCCGFDALTLGFMSYSQWGGLYISDLLSDIWRRPEQWRYPLLCRYCSTVREAFSLTQEDIEGLAILLWLSTLWFKRADISQQWIQAMYKPIFEISGT
jgi:hypothetical protein